MTPDPTAEIKRIRHQLGADDGYDLDRIFARIERLQAELGRECIRRAPRKPAYPQGALRSSTTNVAPKQPIG